MRSTLTCAALLLAACGSGAPPGVADREAEPAGAFAPREGETLRFRREVLRTRRSQRSETVIAGTWHAARAEIGWELELAIESARYAQRGEAIDEHPPDAPPITITQHVDARAVAIDPLAIPDGARQALGSEITRALALAPIGTTGLALPRSIAPGDRLETFASLGVPLDAPIAPRIPMRCVARASDVEARVELACSGSLDRDVELSPELAARGMRAFVRGSLSIRAVLDRETGVALRCEHHIRQDVVEQLGTYEEHESADVTVRTRLEPLTE